MANVILPRADPPLLSDRVNHEDHSICPVDGCLTVEPYFQNGGTDQRREQYLNWNIFAAERQQGGCGASWTATTRQGRERRPNQPVQYLTRSAQAGRVVSAPSEAYRRNWARAFGKEQPDEA